MPKYFGTDGVRGKVGEELTVELALALGKAVGKAFMPRRVLLARDTRVSGPALAAAAAAGLLSQGSRVFDAGILPSPAISHLVPGEGFDLGLVISASHNPPQDNGLKFYNAQGFKLSVAEEERAEAELATSVREVGPVEFGELQPWPEALERYLQLISSFVPQFRLQGWRVVVDCGFGATVVAVPRLYDGRGALVRLLSAEPDGKRINTTGAAAPGLLQQTVRATGADLGIAFDGDGDRALFVDEKGDVVEGDRLMAALAPHLWEWGELKERAVVFTVLANLGAETYLRERGFSVLRLPVGDRNVTWAMHENGVDLGGEPSGHIVFRRYTATGDGILTGLLVLSYLRRLGKSLGELVAPVPMYPQVRKDVPVRDRDGVLREGSVQKAISEAERLLLGRGRLVVRPSGTQSLIRIMAEGPEEEVLLAAAELVAEAVQAADHRLSRNT